VQATARINPQIRMRANSRPRHTSCGRPLANRKKMKIRYKKHRLYFNLTYGFIFIAIGLIAYDYKEENRWTDFGFFFVSLLYFITYFYENFYQYLTIKNGIIRKNTLFSKKINLSEINWIKKNTFGYTLKTDKREFRISTKIIDKNSLKNLNHVLEQLNLPPERTPFANKPL